MKNIRNFLFGNRTRSIIIVVVLVLIAFIIWKTVGQKQSAPQYQTAQVQKGTLITSVTASGQVTTANNVQVTIQASGVVKDVLVKNGDQVSQGQTMADLTLDQTSQQKQASAYASYLSSKNSLDNANNQFNSLQNTLFVANQKFINDAVARGLATNDPTYIEENATWLQAENAYKNQATSVSAAQSSLVAASLNLSQLSTTITAPVSGVVKGLTITPGAIVTVISSGSSSSSSSTSQVLGSIYQQGATQAQVNISEIDSVNVAEGQKVTMTLDAFPNSTFTGKIASINTNGVVSSGVTTYPAVISFDAGNDHIYPNMGVNATIITKVKNDVLLVPSAAVQTSNGQSTVQVLQNGQVISADVTIGDSNDTQTEIISGLSDGETVITGTTTTTRTGSSGSTSLFGGLGGGRGFGGGGATVPRRGN